MLITAFFVKISCGGLDFLKLSHTLPLKSLALNLITASCNGRLFDVDDVINLYTTTTISYSYLMFLCKCFEWNKNISDGATLPAIARAPVQEEYHFKLNKLIQSGTYGLVK